MKIKFEVLSFLALIVFGSCNGPVQSEQKECSFCASVSYSSSSLFKCKKGVNLFQMEKLGDTITISKHRILEETGEVVPKEWITIFNGNIIKASSHYLACSIDSVTKNMLLEPNEFKEEIVSVSVKRSAKVDDTVCIKKFTGGSMTLMEKDWVDIGEGNSFVIQVKSYVAARAEKPGYHSYSVFSYRNKADLISNNLFANRDSILDAYKCVLKN